jgi:hypothetical protein
MLIIMHQSSYRAAIGKAERPHGYRRIGCTQFGCSRRQAAEHCKVFMRERRRQPRIWAELKQKIHLGDAHCVARMQRLWLTKDDLSEWTRG